MKNTNEMKSNDRYRIVALDAISGRVVEKCYASEEFEADDIAEAMYNRWASVVVEVREMRLED